MDSSYETFQISAPQAPTTGDFLSFEVMAGDRERHARISGTALAVLGTSGAGGTREEIFLSNIERIRKAAYEMHVRNPTLDILILGSNNF